MNHRIICYFSSKCLRRRRIISAASRLNAPLEFFTCVSNCPFTTFLELKDVLGADFLFVHSMILLGVLSLPLIGALAFESIRDDDLFTFVTVSFLTQKPHFIAYTSTSFPITERSNGTSRIMIGPRSLQGTGLWLPTF